jgi:hypothetical protein
MHEIVVSCCLSIMKWPSLLDVFFCSPTYTDIPDVVEIFMFYSS